MTIKLKMIGGQHGGQEIEVRKERFMIGRGDECNLRPLSEQVSRHHCALVVQRDGVHICDFNSSNGTFVNGTRIQGEHRLAPGDCVKVGPLEFAVLFGAVPADTNKTRQDECVLEWLTEGSPASSVKDTVAMKLGDTHVQPHPAATPPTVAWPSPPVSHGAVAGATTSKASMATATTAASANSRDSSQAALAAINDFLARMEKDKRRG